MKSTRGYALKASEIARIGVIAILSILALKMAARKLKIPGLSQVADAV